MPFPESRQAVDASPGGDQLDVRNVPNDLKHLTPVTAAAASARPVLRRTPIRTPSGLHKVITRRGPGSFDVVGPPGGIGQRLGDVLGFQGGILAENLVAGLSSSDGAQRSHRNTQIPNATLSAPTTVESRVIRVSCGMSRRSGSDRYCQPTARHWPISAQGERCGAHRPGLPKMGP